MNEVYLKMCSEEVKRIEIKVRNVIVRMIPVR